MASGEMTGTWRDDMASAIAKIEECCTAARGALDDLDDTLAASKELVTACMDMYGLMIDRLVGEGAR